MSFVAIRISALTGILVLIAGCGGSSPNSGTTPATITYNFGSSAPTAVAVKIGSGGFAPATVTSGQITFTLPEGTTDFAVAYACPGFSLGLGATQNIESLNYASSQDGTTYEEGCIGASVGSTGGTNPTATLTGSVNPSSFPGANWLFVWALTANSSFGTSFSLTQGDAFSTSYAPPGTDTVMLALYDSAWNALAVKSLSNQTVPGAVNNGSPVDFGAADATTFEPITYVNMPAGYSVPSTSVNAEAEGSSLLLSMNGDYGFATSNQNPLAQYSVLPAGIAQSGDRYLISSTASKQLPSATSVVSFAESLAGAGPATITFPAPWSYGGPAPAVLPTLDFSYAGLTAQSGPIIYGGSFQWVTSNLYDLIEISLTPNYQSASPSVTVPDLSAIPAFIPPPSSGTMISWSAQIGPEGAATSGSSALGSTSGTAGVSISGTYAVP